MSSIIEIFKKTAPRPEKWEKWTEKERRFVQVNYRARPVVEIAAAIGRPEASIYGQARAMKLKKRRAWTKEEKDFLKENHPRLTAREIARALNKSMGAIYMKAHYLGLKKDKKKPQ